MFFEDELDRRERGRVGMGEVGRIIRWLVLLFWGRFWVFERG